MLVALAAVPYYRGRTITAMDLWDRVYGSLPFVRLSYEDSRIDLLVSHRFCCGRSSYAMSHLTEGLGLPWFLALVCGRIDYSPGGGDHSYPGCESVGCLPGTRNTRVRNHGAACVLQQINYVRFIRTGRHYPATRLRYQGCALLLCGLDDYDTLGSAGSGAGNESIGSDSSSQLGFIGGIEISWRKPDHDTCYSLRDLSLHRRSIRCALGGRYRRGQWRCLPCGDVSHLSGDTRDIARAFTMACGDRRSRARDNSDVS